MKHLIEEDSPSLFSLLTAEEQLSDIRQFFYREREDFDVTRQDYLANLLHCDYREKSYLIHMLTNALDTFNFKTADEVLNEAQKVELNVLGSTVVLVPKKTLDVFYFWARSQGFEYRKVIEHTIVEAYEFLIWKRKED